MRRTSLGRAPGLLLHARILIIHPSGWLQDELCRGHSNPHKRMGIPVVVSSHGMTWEQRGVKFSVNALNDFYSEDYLHLTNARSSTLLR